jgi:hypothetical protein
MTKGWLLLAVTALFSVLASAQTTQPLLQPHQFFPDSSGAPCAGCALWTYSAGTTSPLATYTDSTGNTPNTNPVILDGAGTAAVWLGNSSYKFTLVDASGSTLWTVDNVRSVGYTLNTALSAYLPLAGGTMTGTLNGVNANFTGSLNAYQLGGVYKVDQLAGATADVKLAACEALIHSSGGVCDARGFGATTQSIAATVVIGNTTNVNGYSAADEAFIFSPATVFQPANAAVQMFQFGPGARIYGLNIYTGNVSSYAAHAVELTGSANSWFYLGAILRDVTVMGTHSTGNDATAVPAAGSACLVLKSSGSTAAVAFSQVSNFVCQNEYNGELMTASGDGYINSNHIQMTIYGATVAIEHVVTGTTGAAIQYNQEDIQFQWGNLGPVGTNSGFTSLYALYSHGSGTWGTAKILANQTNLHVWDAPSGNSTIYFPDSSTNGSIVTGVLTSSGPSQIVDTSGENNEICDDLWGTCTDSHIRTWTNSQTFNGSVTVNPRLDIAATGSATATLQTKSPTGAATSYVDDGNNAGGWFLRYQGTDQWAIGHNTSSNLQIRDTLNHVTMVDCTLNVNCNFPQGLKLGGGTTLGNSSSIPQYCGTAVFTASTTSSSLACSWVTASSHCNATWVGSGVSGGALGYTANVGSVTLTAANSNSATAAVFCSVN